MAATITEQLETPPTVNPNRIRRLLAIALLFGPATIVVGTFFVYPLVGVLVLSFSDPEWGLQSYIRVLTSPAVHKVALITLSIAFETTGVCLAVGFPFAYYLTTCSRRRAVVFLVLSTAPLWTATVVRLYAWTLILGRKGVLNDTLTNLRLIDTPLDLLFNQTAVVIGMTHLMLPFMIIILYSSLKRIDRTLLSAAESLGARPHQVFRRIILPLSRPGIFAGSLLVFVISLGFYITPAVLGGGSAVTVALYIQRQVSLLQWGTASALSAVLLALTLLSFWILDRLFGLKQIAFGGSRR